MPMPTVTDLLSKARRVCGQEWPVLLVACLSAGIFASQCAFLGDAKIDDAFITFSYSKNLALGNGPVYSHGVRVEGYSTFLWMILVTLPLIFTRGAAPLGMARVVAAPFLALLGWSVYRLARACGAPRGAAALTMLLLSFSTDLAAAYLTGMETVPYTALLVFAVSATLLSRAEPRWQKWAAWGGLAVGLGRIDGFLPWAVMGGWSLWGVVRQGTSQDVRRFLRTYGPPVALYVIWFLWRWHYYGLFLPSTYYAKALLPKIMPQRGTEYLLGEVSGGALWCGLVAWLWLLWRHRTRAALIGCYVLIHWAYVVAVGGDWMPFGRFVLPTVPFLAVLLVVASADAIAEACRPRGRVLWLPSAAFLGLAALFAARIDHRVLNSDVEKGKVAGVAEQTANVDSYLRAARFLAEVVPSGGRLVTDYGGVFACYTDAAIIEMWGLANAAIATRGGTERINPIYGRTCPECYPELEPEYFHVMQPMVRREPAFTSAAQVITSVWQTDTIGRYIDFPATFTVGRALAPETNEALYFLQRRGGALKVERRITPGGLVIDYPFEKT